MADGMDNSGEVLIEDEVVDVERVHIIGLEKTKRDFIKNEIKEVFKAKTFLEVYNSTLRSRDALMRKGIFKNVEVVIDTTDGYDEHTSNGVQVLFKVKELRSIVGEARTELSSRKQPSWVMKLMSPNIFGRGEKVSLSLCHSLVNSRLYSPDDFDLTFSKPIVSSPGSKISFSGLQNSHDCPWASYNQLCRGLSSGYDFDINGNNHHLELLGEWREMTPLDTSACMEIRRQAGHSLKTSILHSFTIDHTDDPILPSSGKYFKINEELGVYNGTSAFIKEQLEAKFVTTPVKNFTFELATHLGAIVPLSNLEDINVCDKFFIGGPMSLRGFEYNSIGPCNERSYLGNVAYWLLGAHVYTPLPFLWNTVSEPAWAKSLRLHFFVNSGNCLKPKHLWSHGVRALYAGTRLSCGFGVAYNFMRAARLELNFCYPLKSEKSDRISDGLQFGIGVSTC